VAEIRAVIFDMDGVLIDSEPVYLMHQYEHLVGRYPWLTVESMYPVVGMSSQEYPGFMAGLCRRRDDAVFRQELQQVNDCCKVRYDRIMRPQVPAMLEALRSAGLQIALASSSSKENILQVLEECHIKEYFSVIVSGGQFTRSKPDPEIYRYTMEQLGRQPEECLIVEDSTYGIQAGVAAGARVAALRDDRFPFDQRPAHLHIESLAEVPSLACCGGQKIRAAFFDVDGTLIGMGDHAMPATLPATLAALRAQGVMLLLCTGRHALEIQEENLLPGLQFDGAVYMNGQLCEWNGRPVVQNLIPPGELKALRRFLDRHQRSCIFLEKDCMYTNRVDDRLREGQAQVGTAVPPVRSIQDLETRQVYQVIPFVTPEEETALMECMPSCKTLRWCPFAVDVTTRQGGKERGIRAMCDAMGVSLAETIAFGDGNNDVEMLRMAGLGVAMGNAVPEALAAADYVTAAVDQDGLAKALRHFRLI